MKVKTEATIEDLYRAEGKAELVNGEIVHISPTQKLPNYAAGEIFASLREYARRMGRGRAATDNLGFVVKLPHRKSFSLDAAFYLDDDDLDMTYAEGGPVFAVEVRSEGDYGPSAELAMQRKRADYFAVGTLVVWDVDLIGEDVVRVCRVDSPTEAAIYRRGEIAEAEPAVPGWTMPVADLFP